MKTAEALLDIARGQLGVQESPAGSNQVKYAQWYGLTGPWCVMFVMWVFHQAGVALPVRTASCTALMNAAKGAGMWVTGGYQAGDVVIYDWGGDGAADHCGIVESVQTGGIVAIEGNTAVGNDSNGGAVLRRTRAQTAVLGAVRPVYETAETGGDNTPAAAHRAGVAWAVEHGVMTGNAEGDLLLTQPVTRQQLCTMLHRLYRLMENTGET